MKRRTTGSKKRKSASYITGRGGKNYRYDGKRNFKKTGSSKLVIFQNVSACPDRLMLKLRWTGVYRFSPGATTLTETLQANSIFDPSGTIGTDQPLGYNEWIRFYQKYRVYGVKWETFTGYEGAVGFLHITILPSKNSAPPSNIATAFEQPRAIYLGLHEIASRRSRHNKGYWSTSEICGVPPQEVRDENDYAALFTANPARLWYIHFNLATSDGSTNIIADMVIQLIFYVELFERVQLTASAG